MANKQFILIGEGLFLLITILTLVYKHRKSIKTMLLVIKLVRLMQTDLWIVILEDSMTETHFTFIVWMYAKGMQLLLIIDVLVVGQGGCCVARVSAIPVLFIYLNWLWVFFWLFFDLNRSNKHLMRVLKH